MVDIKDKHRAKDLEIFPSYSDTVNQILFKMTLLYNLTMIHWLIETLIFNWGFSKWKTIIWKLWQSGTNIHKDEVLSNFVKFSHELLSVGWH